MEILIIIVLVIGGWLFYKQVNKLNQDVAWLNKEIQEIQSKVREIDGMIKNCLKKTHKSHADSNFKVPATLPIATNFSMTY